MLIFLLSACSTTEVEPSVIDPTVLSGEPIEFTATVRIDARPGGKKFQGVWLERPDGEKWVIDYRPRDCWKPMEGLTVTARGQTYAPEGQAISATHFKVEELRLVTLTAEATLVAVGEEWTLTGTLLTTAGEVGSKSEGSTWTEFKSADGPIWPLYNPSALDGLTGGITLTGREVELSPFSAHIGGPQLCILNARSNP